MKLERFKVVPQTNREDWLKWRKYGIGSSDVPVIMGVSRYKKVNELLKDKVNPETVEDNSNAYIKDRGNKIETIVRDYYSKCIGLKFEPLAVQSNRKDYLLATLDGIDSGANMIIEIKLLTSQKEDAINKEAEGYKKFLAAKEGTVPVDYYPQIQHQLYVTGAPVCIFIGYKEVRYKNRVQRPISTEDIATISVLPDLEYIKKMKKEVNKFWNKVLKERQKNENISTTRS